MADPVLLSDLKVWLGGYDLTASEHTCNFKVSNAELQDQRFGDVQEAKYPGLMQPSVDLGGFYSSSVLANLEPDPVLTQRLQSDVTMWPLTLCPPAAPAAGAGADGNLAYTIQGAQFQYTPIEGQHGQLLQYKLKTLPRSTGNVSRGTILLPKATVAVTTTGVGRNLGAITAGQKLVAVLHVFAITGGTWTLTIESDDNSGFTTPLTRATFTGVTTAPNRQVVEVNGAITDNWWRAVLTKAGGTNITASATLGFVPIP